MTTDGTRWVGGVAARNGWGVRQGIHSPEDRRFVGLAAAALDDYLARNPVDATLAGDRRFDARLPDYSPDGVAEQVRVLNRHLLALDSIDPLSLSLANSIDLATLRRRLTARVHQLRVLDEPRWNPLWWSPVLALEPLLDRRAPDANAILARLLGIPEHLESARSCLGDIPLPHLQRALRELAHAPTWLARNVAHLADERPRAAAELGDAAEAATSAIEEYRHWLGSQQRHAAGQGRLGARRYAEVLALELGTELTVADIKRAAEEELEALGETLRSLASQVLGSSMAARRLVPDALSAVSAAHAVAAPDLVDSARRSIQALRAFTVEQRLMTVPEVDIDVAGMPAVRAGLLAAESEFPGAFGADGDPVRILVAGPEPQWSAVRRDSFLREYNALMLDALMAHQTFPGHALQVAHARAVVAPTAIRSVFADPLFAEGWAMYAADLVMREGFAGSSGQATPAAFALQQVKLQLRAVANALLDIGYHTEDLDEPRARRLLATAAYAEEGEFVVKWRRVTTSAGSLCSYFLGHRLIRDIVAQVRNSHPELPLRTVHDRVLMHGAVRPAALPDLLAVA